MKPLVSIIVPTYNTVKYLRECIDSILGQTYENIEVICIDDGSTDGSPAILAEYAAEDARVQVLSQKNLYAGAARNAGLEVAKGEYLLFLDSDDFFEATMVEKMVASAEEHSSDVVICHSNHYDDKTGEMSSIDYCLGHLDGRSEFSGADMAPWLFQFCVGWPWDKLFRTSFIQQHALRFQEQRTTNDAFFVFIALSLAGRITIVEDALAFHRINNKASISNTREKSWHCAPDATTLICERLHQDGTWDLYEQSFVNWQVHFLLWNFNTLVGDAQNAMGAYIRDEAYPQVAKYLDREGFLRDANERAQFVQVAAFQNWHGLEDIAALAARPGAPKVSVLVPICGAERYIEQALESLAAQTLDDLEFICVVDGSCDRSIMTAKAYELRDSRFVVINKANGGYGHAMNVAFDSARGTYIGILEPDDYVLPNMFESLVNAADKHNAQVVRSDFYCFTGEGDSLVRWVDYVGTWNPERRDNYHRVLCPRDEQEVFLYPMNTWCGLYRRDFLRTNDIRHNETPGAAFQDNGLWFKSYTLAERVVLIDEPCYMYRCDNPGSSVTVRDKALATIVEYRLIRDYLVERGLVFKKVSSVFWFKYMQNVNFSLGRIDASLFRDVLDAAHADLNAAYKAGEIDYTLIPELEAEDIADMIEDPYVYAVGYLKEIANRLIEQNKSKDSELAALRQEREHLLELLHSNKVSRGLIKIAKAVLRR